MSHSDQMNAFFCQYDQSPLNLVFGTRSAFPFPPQIKVSNRFNGFNRNFLTLLFISCLFAKIVAFAKMCSGSGNLTLSLQEADVVYDIVVSQEDYNLATTDMIFAQELLNNHKETLQNTVVEKSPEERYLTPSTSTYSEDSQSSEASWSDAETLLLISLYHENKDAFTNAKKRKHVWEIIAEQMSAHNYFRKPEKLERKWTNLLRVYRSIKDNKGPKKSGRGAQHYKYYNHIDEIIGDKPSPLNHKLLLM
ncbi:hypothetical protein PPYR_00338 [Photinus pyralis]|uniref:Myb-like domain-containing protein n=2 Tax=Photinus pyralis TaxID=7054 RepID=A0A5N4B1H4_PHOPY|nr:hypothetical protein PPYR_00338 [Photinus pyralis]